MAETYVTLTEAAELESIKRSSMRCRLMRDKDAFVTKTVKSGTGGKDVVLVAVSSLSKSARAAWRERERLKELAAEAPPEVAENVKRDIPWYVSVDLDWYIENYKERYYQAVELGNVIRRFLQYDEGDRTRYAEEYAQKYLGKGYRTLYRYTKAYLEASAWADKLQKEDGSGYEHFKVLCLCRKPKESGTFPSIKPEVKQVIKNIWFNKDFAANLGTREMLYEKLTAIAKINGWQNLPSYQTVTRYISYMMEDENLKNAWYLAARGDREYKNKVMVKAERNTIDLKVMELVMGDEHTFDCWVSWTAPNGKVIAIKPRLCAWIDIRSRMILGDVICRDANTDILKQSLLKLLYHDAGSAPRYIYVDNGADYVSKEMTGVGRYDRQRLEFDDAAIGFYRSIGIEDYHRALPYYAWVKGNIERSFKTVCDKFTKWFTSYTGTLTGSKTFAKVEKDVQGLLEQGKLLTMEEFYAEWTKWLHEVYQNRVHSGLKKQGETYKTPLSCWENEEHYMKAVPPKTFATILMMKSETCFVRNVGIKLSGLTYRSDDLCDYINSYVDVKYDPHDMGTIYIFREGKKVCEAYAQELLNFISPHGVEQKALKVHLARQKNQLKKDRERLEQANVPFTELNEQYVGFNKATGGIDLMIGKEPEKKSKASKVVALPTDNTYRSGFRKGVEAEREPEESSYLNSKAESALRLLRAMNE